MNLTKLGLRTPRKDTDLVKAGAGGRCHRNRCRTRLTMDTVDGVLVAVCVPCDRNKRGLCRDCPKKMETNPFHDTNGKNIRFRCDACALRHASALKKAAYDRDPEHYRVIRRRSNAQPHVKAGMRERHKKWLEKNPPRPRNDFERELERRYKRAWAAQFYKDPAKLAEKNRKRREWLATNREAHEKNLERNRAYYRRIAAKRDAERRERRRAAVLAGQVKRLTARDRQWLRKFRQLEAA